MTGWNNNVTKAVWVACSNTQVLDAAFEKQATSLTGDVGITEDTRVASLRGTLRQTFEAHVEKGIRSGFLADDVLRAALMDVDWTEITKAYLDRVRPVPARPAPPTSKRPRK